MGQTGCVTADDATLLGAARAMVAISQRAAGALPGRISLVQLRALTALGGRPSTNLAEFAVTLGLSTSAARATSSTSRLMTYP